MSNPFADVVLEGNRVIIIACDGMEMVRAEITVHSLLNLSEKGARIARQLLTRPADQ